MLSSFFVNGENAHRINGEFVDGEPIQILYRGCEQFTLLDENEEVIGITILETE